jgi:ubiquinone/menaquinone biosynthesis C-methylase UbiE
VRILDGVATRLLDRRDALLGRRDRLTPPRRLSGYVGAEFLNTGDEVCGLLVELTNLLPTEQVLDIGSGIGRVARPLAGYLRSPGSYDGFDVVESGIEWCRRNYTDLDASFEFKAVDVANAFYNPTGASRGEVFRFPYTDRTFDLAFAISLFTHLRPVDAATYLSEAARVLRPNGRLLTTFFMLSDTSRACMADTPEARQFTVIDGQTAIEPGEEPAEAAIAYDEAWVRSTHTAVGLTIDEIVPGWWCGNGDGRSYQDLVVAHRADR